ncbi:MAG TPA: hypothetical protein VKA54_20215 [Gemmatimonadaceae bacterium]|nr:hypothetical protein [Gemmatimonadaceae bacterium]
MTKIHRRAPRVSTLLPAAAAIVLAACGDPSGPVEDNSLAPGQAKAVAATAITVEGGATGTENVLVLVDTALTDSARTKVSYTVTVTGTGAAGAVSAPATALMPSPQAAAARTAAGVTAPVVDISYGARLNARSGARFAGRFAAARAFRSSGANMGGISRSLGVAEPQVGDLVNINVGLEPCDPIVRRGTRVVAIGTQSIVLADTLNPSGGFTTADYQRFAARFDTLVYPLEVANFGAPGDVDANKKVVLLFSSAVNALTPKNSESYVAGFFYNRDLFPTVGSAGIDGCTGSNYSELFYLLAPDPSGLVNGNVRKTSFVDSVTTSVIAHEFEHLINASRRLYITQGVEQFEEGWLDEGLAHVAEELLFYRESGVSPKANLDSIVIRSSDKIRNAFNNDQSSNSSRYRDFLTAPSKNSPFRADDSLSTRGATWNLLRYLADRKGTLETATWQALVRGPSAGVTNLKDVFGGDLPARVRDWNVSHYMDDLISGLPAEFTQESWNWHSLYKAIYKAPYPLEVKAFTGGTASGELIEGSSAYYRFSIPPNTAATFTLTTAGPIAARVVRIR